MAPKLYETLINTQRVKHTFPCDSLVDVK